MQAEKGPEEAEAEDEDEGAGADESRREEAPIKSLAVAEAWI